LRKNVAARGGKKKGGKTGISVRVVPKKVPEAPERKRPEEKVGTEAQRKRNLKRGVGDSLGEIVQTRGDKILGKKWEGKSITFFRSASYRGKPPNLARLFWGWREEEAAEKEISKRKKKKKK